MDCGHQIWIVNTTPGEEIIDLSFTDHDDELLIQPGPLSEILSIANLQTPRISERFKI